MKQKPNQARRNHKPASEESQYFQPTMPQPQDSNLTEGFEQDYERTISQKELSPESLYQLSKCHGWMSYWLACRADRLVKSWAAQEFDFRFVYPAPPQSRLHLN